MSIPDPITTSSARQHSRFFLVGIIVVAFCLIGVLLFWLFSSSADKQEIRNLLENRADALTQKDLSRYLSCFSSQYHSGPRTYNDLQASASQWFAQFVTIRFSFRILDIQIKDDKASVENDYKLSLTNMEGESVNIAKRELLEIRRENNEWKIMSSLSIQ
jgi:ketosteroid isomerase-like protein